MGAATNIAPLVGHGSVRIASMGFEARAPSREEMEAMKGYVQEAMQAGAFGLSTGLMYPPTTVSTTTEFIELSKVVQNFGGIHVSHMRNYGDVFDTSLNELIEINEHVNLPGHLVHYGLVGKRNWSKVETEFEHIQDARKRSIDITYDSYPYRAGMSKLVALFPAWVHEGGTQKLLKRLQTERDRIRTDIKHGIPGWVNWIDLVGYENLIVSSIHSEKNREVEGKSLAEIAQNREGDEFTTLCDLVLEETGIATMIIFMYDEEKVMNALTHPLQMIGSDGWSSSPTGILGTGKPHPRFYGTYPRILGKYVREEARLTLEDAVRRGTSYPAQRLSLRDRGVLRPNTWADLILFDPTAVQDTATFQNPHNLPKGICYVIVNGQIVINQGEHSGVLPGKVLRHSR